MHTCPEFYMEMGLTGRVRFRQQPFTGRPILQVQTAIGTVQYPGRSPVFHHNEWRDASIHEANSLVIQFRPAKGQHIPTG